MIIWRGHGRWLWCAAFEVTLALKRWRKRQFWRLKCIVHPILLYIVGKPWMSTFQCRWEHIIWSSTARVILLWRCRGQLASLQVATMFVYAHCGAVFSLNFSVHHAVPYMLGKLSIPTFHCFLNHLIWSSVAQVILVGSIPLVCMCGANVCQKAWGKRWRKLFSSRVCKCGANVCQKVWGKRWRKLFSSRV